MIEKVYVHGPCGSGKTHHAEALAQHYQCDVIDDGDEFTETRLREMGARRVLVLAIVAPCPGSIPLQTALKAAGLA